jgi:hypothetical protein
MIFLLFAELESSPLLDANHLGQQLRYGQNRFRIMTLQPLTDFLNTLPELITDAPAVLGVSPDGYVKVAMKLDYRITDIWINPQLLQFPLVLRKVVLATIYTTQKLCSDRAHRLIFQYSCSANLRIWDVEVTLFNIKKQQVAITGQRSVIASNALATITRNHHGAITSLILNLPQRQQQSLELSIFDAARQSYEEIRRFHKGLLLPYLAIV